MSEKLQLRITVEIADGGKLLAGQAVYIECEQEILNGWNIGAVAQALKRRAQQEANRKLKPEQAVRKPRRPRGQAQGAAKAG